MTEQSKIQKHNWKRISDFLFEVGMLRRTPRSGYQFLGSGKESVAEHSYRTTVIGYVLAQLTDADWTKVVLMCLFHDLHEARTGDFNYVNRMYNNTKAVNALQDALRDLKFKNEVFEVHEELEEVRTFEAALAQDADQIDLILSLKEEQDLGNPYAPKWLKYAVQRLRTESGYQLASNILQVDHTDWWFNEAGHSWWAKGNGKK